MAAVKDVMLLVRMPPELKGSFQGLCKARGVSVSSELRRFMADQVSGAATGMTTEDKAPKAKKTISSKKPSVVKNRESSRCNDTGDMFDVEYEKPSHLRVSVARDKVVVRQPKVVNDTVAAKLVPSLDNINAINAQVNPIKRKKRKK